MTTCLVEDPTIFQCLHCLAIAFGKYDWHPCDVVLEYATHSVCPQCCEEYHDSDRDRFRS